MNKFKYLVLICIACNTIPSFADVEMMDIPDAFNQLEFQPNVTNQEFDQVINQIKSNTKRGKEEQKQLKKMQKKQNNMYGDVTNTPFSFPNLEDTLLKLPYNISFQGKNIKQGYYQIEKVKIKDRLYLKFKQGHNSTIIPMNKTNEELESDNLVFIKTKKYNDYLKIIYTDMDDTLVNYFKITK